uniref:Uncharacterized protein n=1 Tax=Spongospora subterranea TaxID=70186 RepID=A0A0H5R418_9EUKA|eukprot:CRZ02767.1 hypothetical protein [Spongospora subterranea]
MNPNPILVALWSVIVWVIIGNSIAPLIPPPSSYSFSDEDDPLLIGFNVLETAPPATHFAMVVLVIVSLVGIVPTSIQHVKTIHPDLYHDLYFVRRAISGFCVGSGFTSIQQNDLT